MPLGVLVKEQRGSVLIVAMVLILAMTILGLALFDLAQIEGQMAGSSQTDARALYIAQAGLERGIRELRDGWMADSNAAGGYGTETWADTTNGPTCTPTACDTAAYKVMNIANTSLPATGTDPGGTYTLEMKLVLVAEANNPISQGGGYTYPYGQECIPDTVSPTVCANLVFLRSTGTVNGPPGFTSTVSVQTMVKAWPTSPFAAALTAGATQFITNPAIDGDYLAAGTVQVLGSSSSNPAMRFQGGNSDGLRNNYQTLDGTYELDRIRRRQLVCPPQTNCAGGANLVESLGAEIRIYGGDNSTTMVRLNNNTNAGQSANTASYGQATGGNTRVGKGRLDGVYVATGCLLPCTASNIPFQFGSGAQIWVDYNNYTKAYQDRPPKLPLWYQAGLVYPVLNQPARINGTTYASYSTNFLQVNGAPLDTQQVNGGLCTNNSAANLPVPWECTSGINPATAPTLGDLFNNLHPPNPWAPGSFTDNIRPFRHTFTFTDKTGTVRNAEICWKRSAMGDPLNWNQGVNAPNLPSQLNVVERPLTLEFGIPDCTAPNPPTNPILINFSGPFSVSRSGGPSNYTYRGSAIFLMLGNPFQIEETLLSYCTRDTTLPGALGECPAGERFAEDHLLVFLSPNPVNIGVANNNVNTVMAHVWSNHQISLQRDVKIIGSLRGDYICFRNASQNPCGVGGGGEEPAVYQATPWDLRKIPEELPGGGASGDRWRVDGMPRFYLVCRPGALPTTPTGTCGYQ
jgi:Tfp pilus assembly protein PilX